MLMIGDRLPKPVVPLFLVQPAPVYQTPPPV